MVEISYHPTGAIARISAPSLAAVYKITGWADKIRKVTAERNAARKELAAAKRAVVALRQALDKAHDEAEKRSEDIKRASAVLGENQRHVATIEAQHKQIDQQHKTILRMQKECKQKYEDAIGAVRDFAASHHRDQPSSILLHSLTVDIPSMCDRGTYRVQQAQRLVNA
jgi:chromosome segregation ATPase